MCGLKNVSNNNREKNKIKNRTQTRGHTERLWKGIQYTRPYIHNLREINKRKTPKQTPTRNNKGKEDGMARTLNKDAQCEAGERSLRGKTDGKKRIRQAGKTWIQEMTEILREKGRTCQDATKKGSK
ncbi:hypothetical protein ILUMI_03492 [Ignelater luminosus]|uniref:Uncharacterized protein n=1 Tax=Ignelater luminosus TaxID=2038154 RepID=A0A8K0DAW6_IGNLU|nr:hypothetical protein ILUMI_03492 [Ignelater luminosus]